MKKAVLLFKRILKMLPQEHFLYLILFDSKGIFYEQVTRKSILIF